jgi:hypothetical protein
MKAWEFGRFDTHVRHCRLRPGRLRVRAVAPSKEWGQPRGIAANCTTAEEAAKNRDRGGAAWEGSKAVTAGCSGRCEESWSRSFQIRGDIADISRCKRQVSSGETEPWGLWYEPCACEYISTNWNEEKIKEMRRIGAIISGFMPTTARGHKT